MTRVCFFFLLLGPELDELINVSKNEIIVETLDKILSKYVCHKDLVSILLTCKESREGQGYTGTW